MNASSTSKSPSSIIAWVLALTALGLASMLYLENQGIKQQLAQLQQQISLTQPGSGGRKAEDPYLAGPVKNSILKAAKEIQACYLALLQTQPAVRAGKLKLDWQIDAQGKAMGASVIHNELGNDAFGACVVGKINQITFPAPPAGMTKYVEHSLHFKDDTAAPAAPKP